MVEQERFADVFNFGNRALEVEGFGKDDFEDLESSWVSREVKTGIRGLGYYLLHIDAMASTAEDETRSHGFCEAACLIFCQLIPNHVLQALLGSRSPLGLPLGS